ncbi:MAG TPA: nitronate monooxygenase [Actinomycetes bacterium]|nr:nitronate monooxygenase [Actinomycetes bacterium]
MRERAADLPAVIQGGMGVGISSAQLAHEVSRHGGLGVISGVAPDLLLARWLQDGDPHGIYRAAMEAYPDQEFVARTLRRYFRQGGRAPNVPYRPIHRLDHHQRIEAVRLAALGAYVQVRVAKDGHDRPIGINLLEKIQVWTPAVLFGAMLAGVDVVLVGAGLPSQFPQLLDGLRRGEAVRLTLDVVGSTSDDDFAIELDPAAVVPAWSEPLRRPALLAIVSSHVLASYLARDEGTCPDGFVVEGPVAGGHNAPPRRMALDDSGEPIYGERDQVDLDRMRLLGLPFWLAGGQAGPERLGWAQEQGARGVQAGTVFALSHESGLQQPLRRALLANLAQDDVRVRTDPIASPTGFPFKVVQMPGTVAEPAVYARRDRNCDLGYLRTAYRRSDGSIGQRCPAEPVSAYLRKGGDAEDTEGRVCLCNGLTSTAGVAQLRGNVTEPPLVTLGQDLAAAKELLRLHPDGWGAADVLAWITSEVSVGAVASPARSATPF